MKKIILTLAIIFATAVASFSETPATSQSTDNVNLKVILNPIQTLLVNPAQKAVELEYTTIGDYADGVFQTKADHLRVYSTGAFVVTVQSATNDIKRANGDETISASTIKVKAGNGTTNPLEGATVGEVALSTTATNLINSGTGGVNKTFNVTYSGMGADGYVNSYFNDEKPTVYETTVTYAIVAQ